MTPDESVGRIMTVDQAIVYYERVAEAEKAMGPLSREEKLVILRTVGKDITAEELQSLVQGKKVLKIEEKQ